MSDLISSTKSSPSRSQSLVPMENEEKSFSSISSIYGNNSGIEVKTCAALQEMVSVRIPSHCDQWWCILVSLKIILFSLFLLVCCELLLFFVWLGIFLSRST